MSSSEIGHWDGNFAWHDLPSTSRRVQSVLESTEAVLRRSAAQLRACGRDGRALQAERSAACVRFDLDEPLIARQLYRAAASLRGIRELESLASQVLEKVLSLAGADRGNMQLADPASGALRIVAQCGFDAEFLDHFAVVDDDRSACGRAASRGTQLVVPDVTTDPGFGPHREIAAASGFRAVQSTPLTDRAGWVIGVVSTHYPRPHAPSAQDLRIIDRYAQLGGRVLASRLSMPASAGPGAPGARQQAASAQDAASRSEEQAALLAEFLAGRGCGSRLGCDRAGSARP